MNTIRLFQDEVLPLCSPSYLERNANAKTQGMDGVPDDDLIHTSWGPSFVSHPTWHAWFAKSGTDRPIDAKGYQVGMSGLSLDLARDGVGVALGQRMHGGRRSGGRPTGSGIGHRHRTRPSLLSGPSAQQGAQSRIAGTDRLADEGRRLTVHQCLRQCSLRPLLAHSGHPPKSAYVRLRRSSRPLQSSLQPPF